MRRLRLFIVLTIGALLFTMCAKDDVEIKKGDLQLVTGLYCTGSDGQILITLGNPNDRIRLGDGRLCVFPSPVYSTMSVYCDCTINKIWIVRGRAINTFQDVKFNEYFKETSLDTLGMENISVSVIKMKTGNKDVVINLEDYKEGFYKVIVDTSENGLLWSSFYKAGKGNEDSYDYNFNIWN